MNNSITASLILPPDLPRLAWSDGIPNNFQSGSAGSTGFAGLTINLCSDLFLFLRRYDSAVINSVWPGSHNSPALTGLSAPLLQENIKDQHVLQIFGQKGGDEADISCVMVVDWWSGIIFDLLAEIIGGIIMLGVLPLQLVTLPTLASSTTIVAQIIEDNHTILYNHRY